MERDEKMPTGSSHTVSLLVENKPGVLHRIAGLFSRRGYNIASLTVGPTERPEYSRMTIVVRLSSKTVEQVVRQVQKLVPVVEVRELSPVDLIERELLLVKIRTPEKNHAELRALAETYEAKIVDVSPDALDHRGQRQRRQARRARGPAGALRHPGNLPLRAHRARARLQDPRTPQPQVNG